MNKLTKFLAGATAAASSLYWGALTVLATAGDITLCPPVGSIQPPGCDPATGKARDIGVAGISTAVGSVLNLLLFVAFLLALVFLIVGGIRWIMSGGDKEGAGKAKETVTSALIGLAVVLGSWILINLVLNFFGITGGLAKLSFPVLGF